MHSQRGLTLIELIIYTAVVVVMLTAFYQLFALAGFHKIAEIVETSLFSNGQHVIAEIQHEIENATTITEPTLGTTSDTLRLDGGAVVISIVGNEIVKTKGGVTENLTDQYVIADGLTFEHLGPSSESPTVSIQADLRARNQIDGRIRTETFISSTSIR